MSQRKIIVYQKNSQKPIVLSDDSNLAIEDLKKDILNLLESEKIYILQTKSDLLIGRPTDLQSILITNVQEENNINDLKNKEDITNDLKNKEDSTDHLKYKKDLKIND